MLDITQKGSFSFFVSDVKHKLIKSVNLFCSSFIDHYTGKIIAERVNKITFEKYESSYRNDILSP